MIGPRIGTFLFIVGFALIVLFILSDVGNTPQFGYFFLGVLGVLGGVALWWRAPSGPPPPSSGRFRLLRSMGKRAPKKDAKKK